MIRLHLVQLLLPAILLGATRPVFAHGGAYRGPADATPPAAATAAPGGRAASASVPTGPAGLSNPTATAVPSSSASVLVPPGVMGVARPDESKWQVWWGYNSSSYLDLRGALAANDLRCGSDEFFLGKRPQDQASDRLLPTEADIRERVVPALLRVLAKERDADMVTGALIALAKIGEPSPGVGGYASAAAIAARLESFLADNSQEIAETAAVSLGILAAPAAAETLMEVLHDTSAARRMVGRARVPWRTRAFAAYGLGLAGHRSESDALRTRIVGSLTRAFDEWSNEMPTPDVSVACVSAVGLIALPIAPTPVPGRAKGIAGRKQQIDWLLGLETRANLRQPVAAHVPTAVTRLVEGTPDAWQLKQLVCWRWLARLADEPTLPWSLKQSIVLALGRLGDADGDALDRRIRRTLTRTSVVSRSVELRRFSLIALAQVAARPGSGTMAAELDARRHLLDRLENGRSADRPWVVLALGVLGRALARSSGEPDASVDRLLAEKLSSARIPREVSAYSIAIGMRGQPGTEALLVRRLGDTHDDDTRGYITLALGMAGAKDALEPIQEIVRQSKYRPELLRQSAISLGLLGDKNVADVLIDMLARANSLSAQASIAFGLGAIGDARSIDPLIEMLQDTETTARARAFAAVALGIVCDKETEPWNAKLSIGINYRANTTTLTDGTGMGILEIL